MLWRVKMSFVARKWEKMSAGEKKIVVRKTRSSVAHISNVIHQHSNCSKEFCLRLAEALEVDPRKIMFPELYP